ncbi:MAG: hypothetical protein HY040_03980 [Planctomycetes bacterium]|nr:hypothetical protein [Planctomycetota bacterium]
MPLYNDKRNEHGPFDIIGDVHGCCDELEELLRQLSYIPAPVITPVADAAHAPGSPSIMTQPPAGPPVCPRLWQTVP